MSVKLIRILLIEDNPNDVLLIEKTLDKFSNPYYEFAISHCDSLSEALRYLNRQDADVILLDLGLPDSHGLEIITSITHLAPTIPIVVLTGLTDEKVAIEAVQKGAQDYLIKGQITPNLLARSLQYAIERKRNEEEREKLILELREALARVKTLSGFLPICASCKKIRDDQGYWRQIEAYIRDHSEAEFSHCICPDCARKLYPELEEEAN